MSRSIRLLAVAVMVLFVLSPTVMALGTMELAYDNGIWNTFGGDANSYAGVWFSLPSGVSSANLRYVRWARSAFVYPLEIHITGPNHVTELSGSPIILNGPAPDPAGTGCPAGWPLCSGLDLTSYGFVVTGDFFVIFYWAPTTSTLLEDTGVPLSGRLVVGSSLATLAVSSYQANGLIRVDIDPIAPIPEYPLGLPLLAIFMVISYGLIRRRTSTKKL